MIKYDDEKLKKEIHTLRNRVWKEVTAPENRKKVNIGAQGTEVH